MLIKIQGLRFMSVLYARLGEASTYAGLSALCVAMSTALSLTGTTRYVALFGAIAAGVGAVAKSENNPKLANAMDQAMKLVPLLSAAVISAENLLPSAAGTVSPNVKAMPLP